MTLSPQHQADPRFTPHASRLTLHVSRFTIPLYILVLALVCLSSTACSTTDRGGKIISEGPSGTVSLQTIPDYSITANHPIELEPSLLAKVFRGIQVQDQGDRGLQSLLAGASPPIPAFSEDQVQFLAPLVAEGLRTASPTQQIEYRVEIVHQGSGIEFPVTETTAGSLYAYGRQLFVTLHLFRSAPTWTNMNVRNMHSQSYGIDYTGLFKRVLVFTPREAQRSDSFDPPPGVKRSERFLAVDYELLQHVSPAVATTEQTKPQDTSRPSAQAAEAQAQREKDLAQREKDLAQREADIQRLKDIVNKNVSEVENMRKQLESVQKQLGSESLEKK